MLDRMTIANFKSWGQADLRFGRITGLFGTNSSGKSSLIQFLLLLKQTREATDNNVELALNGLYLRLGDFAAMIHTHDDALRLQWGLTFTRPAELALPDPAAAPGATIVRGRQVSVRGSASASVSRESLMSFGPFAEELEYVIGGARFQLALRQPMGFELSASGTSFQFQRTPGRPWHLPGPVKSYAFPDQARTYFQNAAFLSDLELAFEEQIDQVFYLGPLREFPQRDYVRAPSRPRDVGQRGERAIDAILAATSEGLQSPGADGRQQSFQEAIGDWLHAMGLIEAFTVCETARGSGRWEALMLTRQSHVTVPLTDVGFGVSQVLPVITLLLYVPEGSTVILEQPEIHLHPLAQAELADVIINTARNRNLQVIVESHSEHLLLRLQRRVAEASLSADDCKLYFCRSADGESLLEPLALDEYGNIGNWPEHFMGDAFGETYAAEKARLIRMAAAQ